MAIVPRVFTIPRLIGPSRIPSYELHGGTASRRGAPPHPPPPLRPPLPTRAFTGCRPGIMNTPVAERGATLIRFVLDKDTSLIIESTVLCASAVPPPSPLPHPRRPLERRNSLASRTRRGGSPPLALVAAFVNQPSRN